MILKQSKFFEPYYRKVKEGKTVYACSMKNENKSGVYFIASKQTKKIVYIGSAKTSLYKTIYRHFQEWDSSDRREERKVFPKSGYYIRVIFCPETKARSLEKFFILKFQPEFNTHKYETFKEKKEVSQYDNLTFDNLPLNIVITENPF